MRYVKAAIVGIASALVTAIAWGFVALFVAILVGVLMSYVDGEGSIGGASGNVGTGSLVLAALLGFGAGFFWTLRRSNRVPL